MSAMKITIRGFYDFMGYIEDDLFKNMVIPESPLLDRNTLILNILQKSDDLESLYSDPYYIQESLTYWSKKWERTFQKWVDALNKTYEPLYNVDMHQDTIDKTTTDRDEVIDDTLTSARDIQENETSERDIKDHETSDTDEDVSYSESNTISAFNAETLRNDTAKTSTTATDVDYTRNATTDDDLSRNIKTDDDLSSTQKNIQAEDTVVDYIHSDHWFGRDHMPAQDLLEKELKVAQWNIYDHITDIFLQEYCILVY